MSKYEKKSETEENEGNIKVKKWRNVVILLFLGGVIGVIGYRLYMNLEPFNGEKIAGVPTGHIKIVNQQEESLAALFIASGTYAYNTSGKTVSVYVDYYEKEVRKKHDLVASVDQMDEGPLAGTIYTGLTSAEELGEFKDLLVTMINGEARYTGNYSFEEININTEKGLLFFGNAFENGKVVKGKKYVMQAWSTGEKIYNDEKDLFSNEFLKDSPQTVLFYFIIK